MTPDKPCLDNARDRLDDYADGLLAPEPAGIVARHLEACAPCRNDLEWLRRFERAARAAHLSSAEIVDAAWGGLPANDPHLRDCPICREELEAVRGAVPVEAPRLLGPASSSSKQWSRSWMVQALAASLVAGIGVVLLISRGDAPPPRTSGGDSSTTRGLAAEVRDLAPSGELSRSGGELAFSWSGKPLARYAVLFFTADGRVLARIEVSGTRLLAGPLLRGRIESEAEFFWKVDPIEGDASASGSQLTRVAWKP